MHRAVTPITDCRHGSSENAASCVKRAAGQAMTSLRSSPGRFVAALALLSAAAGVACAQDPSADAAPPAKFPLKVTLQVRLRLEGWDWFDTPLADGTYEYFASQ